MKATITIEGATNAGANYLTWTPVRGNVRLEDTTGTAGPVAVTLRNRNTSQGGQIVFAKTLQETMKDQLSLSLPVDGSAVDFFVAGMFKRPSVADNDAIIEVVASNAQLKASTKSLMVRIRKNANTLTP
ncbi:MAG: tyrosinase, partial [Chloroflexia bacterium]|nr:tyrosinase [Chloroflexia bacterium]